MNTSRPVRFCCVPLYGFGIGYIWATLNLLHSYHLLVVALTNKSTIQTFSHELQTKLIPHHILQHLVMFSTICFGFCKASNISFWGTRAHSRAVEKFKLGTFINAYTTLFNKRNMKPIHDAKKQTHTHTSKNTRTRSNWVNSMTHCKREWA